MSIPSSPPALPDEVFNDPPSSPPLPPVVFPTRKRHADYESSLSSDPIFSEDASEESEMIGVFKKKKYTKGPWFRHASSHLQEIAASASQNKDSGVWMGSDSSTDSIAGCNKRVQTLSFQDFAVKRAPTIAPAAKAKSPQDVAAELVFRAVDACQETIDLSEMQLRSIPNEVLRPLHQLIRLPIAVDDSQKITADHYAPLTPEIKLYLAKNELTTLPSELWNLGNLTVLSLRNNELTELPPSAARLRNLKELNVAGNQLQCLPWELLSLLLADERKLRTTLGPNPFLQPLGLRPSPMLSRFRVPNSTGECLKNLRTIRARFPTAAASDTTYEALLIRLHETRLHQIECSSQEECTDNDEPNRQTIRDSQPIYVASSKTTYLDFDGSVMRSPMSSFSPRTTSNTTATLSPTPLPQKNLSSAPSLFELSARACARSPYIDQLSDLLPDDASPPVTGALDRVIKTKSLGLSTCSVCRKHYVIPRAEWIEYWFDGHGSGEQFLPFLRRACSWRCVEGLSTTRARELDAIRETVAQVGASVSTAEFDEENL
ncbi:hypothetical protein AAFC00_003898 [Neodothiora populina]|uniref:Uncharacterized protein n=1 Tax=Neodothiora populina TaxID=2781224 RepID=A0ABR3PFU1_9PEZI